MTTYPNTPGFQATQTSRDAAVAMEIPSHTLKGRCLAALRVFGDMTADEVALKINESPFSIRPRMTELKKLGLIEPTGFTRPNSSSLNADVMRVRVRETEATLL